jgi:demethylmenaquinone methyltransferase/2-methoxy-6-polyprenyl-1,4-benzoquinol methylase
MIEGPRPEEIRNLFSEVAFKYDKANDAMTFGLARLWRRDLVRWSGAGPGDRILDCATGTGDLAIEFKRAVGDLGEVVGTDFCAEMLNLAPPKAEKLGLKIDFQLADVTQLPFEDSSFQVASIAYGIRNVENPVKALQEMARVVKTGGSVMILETGAPHRLFRHAFDFYFQRVVPRVGGWVTGKRHAYEYLNRSSRKFPSGYEFLELLSQTGAFDHGEYRTLMGGASFLYRAVVK